MKGEEVPDAPLPGVGDKRSAEGGLLGVRGKRGERKCPTGALAVLGAVKDLGVGHAVRHTGVGQALAHVFL
jgi:hypothetical protein